MKNLATINLVIFFVLITALASAGLVLYQNSKNTSAGVAGIPTPQTSGLANNSSQTAAANISLTIAEIAKHNSASDCWIIISNKVYNVTSDIPNHPGGPGTIIPYCGKDATSAFSSKDMSPARNHSSSAYSLLANFYIGNVGQALTNQQLQAQQNNINNNAQNTNNNFRRDNESEGD